MKEKAKENKINKLNKLNVKIDKVCNNIFTKCIGLMFSSKPKTTLLVNHTEKPTSIHTFFMLFPIDVYWLDGDKKIIHKQSMNPWKISRVKIAKYVLETKTNLLDADVGDELIIREKLFESKEELRGILTSIASEKSLAKNWLRKEEDEAWEHLQKEM